MRLGEVTLQQIRRNRVVAAGQVAQELVVQTRRLEHRAQPLLVIRRVAEDLEHLAVLVAELELDDPVLQRLEAGRVTEHAAELDVLARGQRGQDAPLLEELALDLLDAREALLRRAEVVGGQAAQDGVELVDDQPHPELGRLVLDDEQQLVVVLGLAQRVLGAQQPVEVEVAGVGLAPAEVAGDAFLDVAQISGGVRGGGSPPGGCLAHSSASSSSRR